MYFFRRLPLEKELQVVNSFIELENMKYKKPFKVVYDIDSSDFEVPYFSLQPLVENVVKYSKINEKEDGYLSIETYEDDKFYYINLSDNGCGFDVKNVKTTSFGIANSRERFKLLSKAQFSITSKEGEGTSILIKIPRTGGNENENNNN